VSYQPVVFLEEFARRVKPFSGSHVSAALKLSQVATIKSSAFVVAAIVPVRHLVLDSVATFEATLSTKLDAHDVVVW
jgi:hypothetical protein